MIDTQSKLITRIERAIGADHVEVSPNLRIDGLAPGLIARPSSTEEVSECMVAASEAGAAVVPAGFGTWLESGNPIRSANLVLSLERLNQVLDYSPPDLTMTVGPGLDLDAINRVAGDSGQWLPLDPPGSAGRSIGAIVACASSGALRPGFGTPRDYCIGLGLCHADGSISKSGGKVAKNVAGYDMNKLYVGSFGTLAVIDMVRLKLRPLPERDVTVVLTSETLGDLLQIAHSVVKALRPASMLLASPGLNSYLGIDGQSPADRYGLLIRYIENASTVSYQLERANQMLTSRMDPIYPENTRASELWRRQANLDQAARTCIRLSVRPSDIEHWFTFVSHTLPGPLISAEVPTGLIRAAFSAGEQETISTIQSLRRDLGSQSGGTLFIERATSEIRRLAGAWNEPGPAGLLMETIKDSMDPNRILSPGRLVCGI